MSVRTFHRPSRRDPGVAPPPMGAGSVRYVMRTRLLVAAAVLALLALTGCARDTAAAGAPVGSWSPLAASGGPAPPAGSADTPGAADGATARPATSPCGRDGWDCAQEMRFDTVA